LPGKEVRQMTEPEWFACDDPKALLKFLNGRASTRKLCLFAVACCERLDEWLTDARSRSAVAALRRFADGRADKQELGREARDAGQATESARGAACIAVVGSEALSRWRPIASSGPTLFPGLELVVGLEQAQEVERAVWRDGAVLAASAVECALHCAFAPRKDTLAPTCFCAAATAAAAVVLGNNERLLQCQLLRDVFGSPFRQVTVSRSLLAWNDWAPLNIAEAIYNDRDFTSLPVLADALQEAGCSDEALLLHCRAGGAHTRGCWAVDAVLGLR
jgi:hypothetical protein